MPLLERIGSFRIIGSGRMQKRPCRMPKFLNIWRAGTGKFGRDRDVLFFSRVA